MLGSDTYGNQILWNLPTDIGHLHEKFKVAWSDPSGAMYGPSRMAQAAGVLAVYPNSSNNLPLHMGASPAIVYILLWILENIVCSTGSRMVCSTMPPPDSSAWIVAAL